MKSRVLVCLLIAVCSTALRLIAQSPHPPAQKTARTCSTSHLQQHVTLATTEFQAFRDKEDGQACLLVKQSGKVVFRRTNDNDGWFEIGQKADQSLGAPAIPAGTDVTGNERPDVLVSFWTGGAHCCRVDYVFEVEPRVRLLATLQAQDADRSFFMHSQGEGSFRYVTADYVFAYWYGSFAGSPVHEIVLRYVPDQSGGAYHLDWKAMYKAPPTKEEWQKARDAVDVEVNLKRRGMAEALRSVLWQEVLDLIYTGHPELAWRFIDEVGQEAQSGDDPSLDDFCGTLKNSFYWPDLKKELSSAPAACLNAKRSR